MSNQMSTGYLELPLENLEMLRPYAILVGARPPSPDEGKYGNLVPFTHTGWASLDHVVRNIFTIHSPFMDFLMRYCPLTLKLEKPILTIDRLVNPDPRNSKVTTAHVPVSYLLTGISNKAKLEYMYAPLAKETTVFAQAMEKVFLGIGEPVADGVYGVCNHPNRRMIQLPENVNVNSLGEKITFPAIEHMKRLFLAGLCLYLHPKGGNIPEWRTPGGMGEALRSEPNIKTMAVDFLPAGERILVRVTPEDIRAVIGIRPTLIQYGGEMVVVSLVVPQITENDLGKANILHYKGVPTYDQG